MPKQHFRSDLFTAPPLNLSLFSRRRAPRGKSTLRLLCMIIILCSRFAMLVFDGKMETSSEPVKHPRGTPRRVPGGCLQALAPSRAREINSLRHSPSCFLCPSSYSGYQGGVPSLGRVHCAGGGGSRPTREQRIAPGEARTRGTSTGKDTIVLPCPVWVISLTPTTAVR